MLTHSQTIRDVSRALPALASDPGLDGPVSADLLDAHAAALREWYDKLSPVIDHAGNTLAEAIEAHDPKLDADPDGEGARALERAEAYFKNRRKKLLRLRNAFVDIGASPNHKVFDAVDRLDNLHMWIVATMQEVRWSVLIFDGVQDRAKSPDRRAFTSGSEWLASLHGE